jgi:gliding motility-associated-like protein
MAYICSLYAEQLLYKRMDIKRLLSFLVLCLVTLVPALTIAQCTTTITVTPSTPYLEDFEAGPAWTVDPASTASDWAWGTPSKPIINGAASGTKCWVTGGLTNSSYANGENSYVVSPCFDMSQLSHPFISMRVFWESEGGYDGGNLYYSVDGSNWKLIGMQNDQGCGALNWYNSNVKFLGTEGWSGTKSSGSGSSQWLLAEHALPYTLYPDLKNATHVRFRFNFAAGTAVNNFDGFAFDDFSILDKSPGPIIDQITGANDLCLRNNNTVQLNDITPGGTWTSSNKAAAIIDNSGLVTAVAKGKTTISYTITSGSCTVSQDTVIHVNDFHFSLAADQNFVTTGTAVTLKSSSPDQYTVNAWFPQNQFPDQHKLSQVTTPTDPATIYQVAGQSAAGCTDTASLKLVIVTPGWFPFVPNAFTPNNDGKNDLLFVYGSGIVSMMFQVYDQWGNLVFSNSDKDRGWNGMSNAKTQPMGVYVYVLKALMEDGRIINKKGSLTLVR